MQVNYIFNLTDLFEILDDAPLMDDELTEKLNKIFFDISQRIRNSIGEIEGYPIEFKSDIEKIKINLEEKIKLLNVSKIAIDPDGYVEDGADAILGPCPNKPEKVEKIFMLRDEDPTFIIRQSGTEELIVQFELDCTWQDAEECLAKISANDTSCMSIRTYNENSEIGYWYEDGEKDDTDWEKIPLEFGRYESNYQWSLDSQVEQVKAPEELAKDPNTPPETLRELGQDENIDIRMTVAANPGIPLDLAQSFIDEDDEWIRMNVARYTPHLEILKKLAVDEAALVRGAVAKNSNTPPDLLEMLKE